MILDVLGNEVKFNIGDEVIDMYGAKGKIVKICLRESGISEATVEYENEDWDGKDITAYQIGLMERGIFQHLKIGSHYLTADKFGYIDIDKEIEHFNEAKRDIQKQINELKKRKEVIKQITDEAKQVREAYCSGKREMSE